MGAPPAALKHQDRSPRPLQDSLTPPAQSEQRVALVIGNGAYKDAPLKNPVSDAKAMAEALRDCGFRVDLVLDADRTRMFQAVRDFGQKISGGGVGLFYFAGHGMAVKGTNYLIPVNTDIASEDEVPVQALDVSAVLGKMETAKNRLNLLILDACRNNPFGHGSRSGSRGLAQMDAPSGSFIAYATAPGSTASDGDGKNGLYTQHLLRTLREPGLKVEEVFKRVRVGVKQASRDQQVPWDSSSLTGDFYFRPGASSFGAPAVSAPAPDPASLELAYWDSIKDSRTKEDFAAYLEKYPKGTFADIAQRRIQALSMGSDGTVAIPAGAAPPPSVDALKGNLQVAVTGAEARVLLDGVFKGVAKPEEPLNLTGLLAGEFKLKGEAPGCVPTQQTVQVEAGKWSQAALSMKKALRLIVYRKPRTLINSILKYDIFLDDRKVATLANKSYINFEVPSGNYSLKVIESTSPDCPALLHLENLPKAARYFRLETDWKKGQPILSEVPEETWKSESVRFGSKEVEVLK